MDEQMKILVNMLKERINSNLQIIKKNEENIRKVLLQPLSNERTNLLKDSFGFNKKLLAENQESLAVEIKLINYLVKLREFTKLQPINNQTLNQSNNGTYPKESPENKNDENQMEDEDLFNLTLLGKIPFNKSHPKFNDEKFFEDLFENYKQIENYEMCSILVNLKGKKGVT